MEAFRFSRHKINNKVAGYVTFKMCGALMRCDSKGTGVSASQHHVDGRCTQAD